LAIRLVEEPVRLDGEGEDASLVALRFVNGHRGFSGLIEVCTWAEDGKRILARLIPSSAGVRYVFAEVG
jgi:hypothetical protein